MTDRPRLLIVSFSPLARDARLLRQIRGFADDYAVTTCGFGPSPHPDVTHVELTVPPVPPRAAVRGNDTLLAVHAYRAAYRQTAHVRAARAALAGRVFDAVLANDVDTVPLAVALFGGARVHADLHEHWPTLHAENPRWRALRGRYYRWLIRRRVTRAASVTTVSGGIAAEYTREFGIPVGVVVNATPYADLAPTPVHDPLRLVYSGGGGPARRLEVLVEAAARTRTAVALTLYLVGTTPQDLTALRSLADRLAAPVRIEPGVPYRRLLSTLNDHDLGVYTPAPINLDYELSLPNKVFDFVQARLGLLVSPAREIAQMVTGAGVGTVTEDYSVDALTRRLDALTPETVARYKAQADVAARPLSAQAQQHVWEDAVAAIVRRSAHPERGARG